MDWKNIPKFCTPTPFRCFPLDFEYRIQFNLIEDPRGGNEIEGPDDGIVLLTSVETGEFNSFGYPGNYQTNLFSDEEFDKAMSNLDP